MNTVLSDDQRSYRSIITFERVSVKVPDKGPYMEQVPAHQFDLKGTSVRVPEHWRNSFLVPGTKTIVQRNFFGITQEDLERKMIATVEVVEKTTVRGLQVMLLNITKVGAGTERANSELKFAQGEGIELPGTDMKIVFKPRGRRQETGEIKI